MWTQDQAYDKMEKEIKGYMETGDLKSILLSACEYAENEIEIEAECNY